MEKIRGSLLAVASSLLAAFALIACQAAPGPDFKNDSPDYLANFKYDVLSQLGRNIIPQYASSDFDPPYYPTVFESADGSVSVTLDNDTNEFDLDTSMVLASFQSTSYCRDYDSLRLWNCTRCQKPELDGFLPEGVIYDAKWDLFALVGYFPQWKAKLIVFRGTNSHDLKNWIEDFDAWRTKFPLPFPNSHGALIHSGFYKMFAQSALKPNVTAAMKRLIEKYGADGPTHVVGHSMGGAIADLCALWMKFKMNLTDVRVTTFGSPRTGNHEFAKFFNNTFSQSWRFTHNRDIVPALPWEVFGYWHVPREIWQVDVKTRDSLDIKMTFKVCDLSGEDPSCHDSVCHYASCTSIDDHMMYLGHQMYEEKGEC